MLTPLCVNQKSKSVSGSDTFHWLLKLIFYFGKIKFNEIGVKTFSGVAIFLRSHYLFSSKIDQRRCISEAGKTFFTRFYQPMENTLTGNLTA